MPLKHRTTPVKARQLNFCRPRAILPKNTRIGEQALISEVRLLVTSSSATVVIPFAITSINKEKINWYFRLVQPIHLNSFL